MNKQISVVKRTTTRVVGSNLPATFSLLSLLLLVMTFVVMPGAAFAQAGGAVTKGLPTNTSVGPNNEANEEIMREYDKRFPFMRQQRRDDTHTRTAPGTKNEESDEGSQHSTMAYKPVIKLCDTCHYGIAYMQIPMMANNTTLQSKDNELFKNQLTTNGMPLSDTQFQVIQRENHQRMLELLYDPEKIMWMTKATAQMGGASAANSMAGTAEQSFGTALDRIINADGNNCLINVANEASGAGYPGMVVDKTIPEAVGMVQRMYRQVFIPMAILFLLPGAVASQVKGQIGRGFNLNYAESMNPFEGILRSIVAVFLIPATQVIVSWSIDTGNSMAMSVRDWVDIQMIQDWANQLSYNTSPDKDENVVRDSPLGSAAAGAGQGGQGGAGGAGGGGGLTGAVAGAISGLAAQIGGVIGSWLSSLANFVTAVGGGGDGLGAQQPETAAIYERQGALSQIMQLSLNTMMNVASIFLVVLGAYQLVIICYMFLLGPLAAAFYAWPQVSGKSKLFRSVFGSWVEGVIKVALWRFYWMVVLAVMTQRLIYTNGGTTDLQWEVCMFTCFLGILLWAPSSPFSFSPNGGLDQAVQLAQSNKKQGGGGGGGGGGKGGGKGADTPGGDKAGDDNKSGSDSATVTPTETNNTGTETKSETPSGNKDDKPSDSKDTAVAAAPPLQGQGQAQGTQVAAATSLPPSDKKGDGDKASGDKGTPQVTVVASADSGKMESGQPPVGLSGKGAKTATNPGVETAAGSDASKGSKGSGASGGTAGGGTQVADASSSASASASVSVEKAAGEVGSAGGGPPSEKKKKDDGGSQFA